MEAEVLYIQGEDEVMNLEAGPLMRYLNKEKGPF